MTERTHVGVDDFDFAGVKETCPGFAHGHGKGATLDTEGLETGFVDREGMCATC